MNKIKRFVLLLGIILPVTFVFANSELTTTKDGVGTIIINKAKNKEYTMVSLNQTIMIKNNKNYQTLKKLITFAKG